MTTGGLNYVGSWKEKLQDISAQPKLLKVYLEKINKSANMPKQVNKKNSTTFRSMFYKHNK